MPARAVTSSPYKYKEEGSPVWHTTSSNGAGVGAGVAVARGPAVGAAVPGPNVGGSRVGAAVAGVPVTAGAGLGCEHATKKTITNVRNRRRILFGQPAIFHLQHPIPKRMPQGRAGPRP